MKVKALGQTLSDRYQYGLLDHGLYATVIRGIEKRPNKKGTGSYLLVTLEVTEGEHKGRRLYDYLNVEHVSPKAVAFAQQRLQWIAKACGKDTLTDTDELLGCEIAVEVTQKERSDTGDLVNEVRGYWPITRWVLEGLARYARC